MQYAVLSAWKTSTPTRIRPRTSRARGNDHELLEVEPSSCACAAVDDVHERHGRHARPHRRASGRARRPRLLRQPWPRRASTREWRWRRDATCSACRRARSASGRAPAGRSHRDPRARTRSRRSRSQRPSSRPCPESLAAVAKLHRLEPARRGPGRGRGAAHCSRLEPDLGLDRRVAARIEHLPRAYRGVSASSLAPLARSK